MSLDLGVIVTNQGDVSQHIFFEQFGDFIQQIRGVILYGGGEDERAHLRLGYLTALLIDPGMECFINEITEDLIEIFG